VQLAQRQAAAKAAIYPRISKRQESTGRLRMASQKRGQMRRQGLWPTEPARARKTFIPGGSHRVFRVAFDDVK
jgi:hypothetical protein